MLYLVLLNLKLTCQNRTYKYTLSRTHTYSHTHLLCHHASSCLSKSLNIVKNHIKFPQLPSHFRKCRISVILWHIHCLYKFRREKSTSDVITMFWFFKNVESAHIRVDEGTYQLSQAERYKTKARKKKCILALIGVILLVVLIAIIAWQAN